MRLPFWLLRLLPMWEYICPKCRKTVKKSSHEWPHCGERFPLAIRVPPRFLKDSKKLEEYVHKHIFPRVSAFERNYLTQYFTTLFAHGFEGGNFGNDPETGYAWTGTSGSPTVETDNPHHGTYNAEAALINDGACYAYKTFTGTAIVYARFYVKFLILNLAQGAAGTYRLAILSLQGGNWQRELAVVVTNTNGTYRWGLFCTEWPGSQIYTAGTHTPVINTWYCVEILRDVTNDIQTLWIDGIQECTNTTAITTNTDRVIAGIPHMYENNNDNTVAFDCVVVADEGPIRPEEGPTLVEVADSLELAETVLRNKTLILSDSLGLADSLYGNKSLVLSDSASLSELVTVIIGEVMKYVTDAVSSADFVSTPSRVLRALEAIGATDNAVVNKVLQITETVGLAEIVEVGVGGVKKTKLFLILGDLAVQLTGD